jgi:high affinity Mn2+ porin
MHRGMFMIELSRLRWSIWFIPATAFFIFHYATSAQLLDSPRDSSESWSSHFQYTGIEQIHGPFSAKYSGVNSLRNVREDRFSVTSTLFLGRRLWPGGEAYLDPEMSGGSGFSSTTGIAGFPNGEIYRVDDVSPKVFIARAFLRQNFSLGGNEVERIESNQNQLACMLPKSRLTLTVGKFSLTDIFDDNTYSHDPRTQFMNWSIWASGAWDYSADTRGYDWGIVAELHQPTYVLNVGVVLVPSYANGPVFDTEIGNAYSLNLEFVKPYRVFEQKGTLHVIGFLNRAHMGNYREAIDAAVTAGTTPDIVTTRSYCVKYGFSVGIEQPLTSTTGLFSRFSWNDGATETWAYTEIDRSLQLGINVRGDAWNRNEDNLGLAFVANGLSNDHRDFLAAGGNGFLIGDGRLNYGLEQIAEVFYCLKLTSTFWLTLDDQVIINPAYNKDRGPFVNAFGARGHVEL